MFRRASRRRTDDDDLRERVARAICAADGVDPDQPCLRAGRTIAGSETVPAWRLSLRQADAALTVVASEIERLTQRP